MQSKTYKSNKDRTQATRAQLIAAARELFVEGGYADTGTPAIVKKAKVTRGALYHHFADKADLLTAVIAEEAQAVAESIISHAEGTSAIQSLKNGSRAYIEAMQVPGRTRLLLEIGPAVLGTNLMRKIDDGAAHRTLLDGLKAVIYDDQAKSKDIEVLADLLSAAFDRAAIAVSAGADAEIYVNAMERLIEGSLAR